MRLAFRIFLVICLVGLSLFSFGQHRSFNELKQRFADHFDSRPTREILMLGNSRTYFNHMPQMLRQIADSAGSPQKYQITEQLPGGSSLELLWDDAYTQQLLGQSWDDAIVQAESRAFSGPAYTESFSSYGPKLLKAIRLRSGRPDLVVNWAYDPTAAYPFSDAQRDAYQRDINAGFESLALKSGAHQIRLSTLWDDVHRNHPDIALTFDGNHPTLAGSYLYALLLYSDLSNGDLAKVTYVPSGLSVQTAAVMKDVVQRHSLMRLEYRGTLPFAGAQGLPVATR